jgi:PAS fold.
MPNGELDYVNQRALDYFELPFAELVESGWMNGVHPEDLAHTLEHWQNALARARRTRTSSASSAPRTCRTAGTSRALCPCATVKARS